MPTGARLKGDTLKLEVYENQKGFEDSLFFNMGQLLSIPFILIGIILIARNVMIIRKKGNK